MSVNSNIIRNVNNSVILLILGLDGTVFNNSISEFYAESEIMSVACDQGNGDSVSHNHISGGTTYLGMDTSRCDYINDNIFSNIVYGTKAIWVFLLSIDRCILL